MAVAWGSPALRAVADEVIPGTGPPAVAASIRRILRQPRLSAAQMGRRRLHLGHQRNGEPVSLAARHRIEGHLRRHDFSRWLGDVFRDGPLCTRLQAIEQRADTEDARDIAADIAQAIRARYETAADERPEGHEAE